MSIIKPIDKIVILGGGSAGWMTAAILIKAFPNRTIVVIESPSVPILGVGESTLGTINQYCQYLGIDELDFMRATDASYKMSIKFTDFYEKDAGSFHYPFGHAWTQNTIDGIQDWFHKKHLYPDTPVQDFIRNYFPAAALFEQNKFDLNEQGQFDNYNPRLDVAYHFDATKFGRWLRDHYCVPRGVQHVVDTVAQVNTSTAGIDCLVLESGPEVRADLFVDCTGFKSLLLGDALEEPFVSYSDMLPNNRAIATHLPYKDQELETEPFTNSTALGNGWVWNIPLWSRIGTGYVYNDQYADFEQALEEFKQHLMSDKMLVPRSREEVDALVYKDIPMRVGIHKRTFVKNVVAIGLSAGFIEPLESNGLFSVHEFLFKLVMTLERPAVTQWDRDMYNGATCGIFRNFAEFVALHYALSIRNDTPYWQANADRVYDPGLATFEPSTSVGFRDLHNNKMFTGRMDNSGGITWVSIGMNYLMFDRTFYDTFTAVYLKDKIQYKQSYDNMFAEYNNRRARWAAAAQDKPSLYQYLKDNIHSNNLQA